METEPIILYVDDQVSHRTLFQKAFQGRYEVISAASGEEAIEILHQKKIALIIADHNMPGMTGIDLLQKAREISPESQQAILSAYLDEKILKEASLRVKLARHFEKPWKLEPMRGFIEEALEKYLISAPAEPAPFPQEIPGLPVSEIVPPGEFLPHKPFIATEQLAQMQNLFMEKVDQRGAKRVFLQFVEPKIRPVIHLIRKPFPALLREAQEAAVTGNVEKFEKLLTAHLKEQDFSLTLAQLMDSSGKILH